MEQVKENVLDKVPYRRVKGKTVDVKTRVIMPKFSKAWKAKAARALSIPEEVTINLDARSSAAWKLIDGKRTVREIGERMHDEFGEKIEPLYPRLAHLLRIMEMNDLIGYRKVRRRRRPTGSSGIRPRPIADEGDGTTEEGDDGADPSD